MLSHIRLRRPRRMLAAALAAGAVVTGLVAPAAQAADAPAEVIIPAGARYIPRDDRISEAGATGYLHTQEGSTGTLWTDYATGGTRAVDASVGDDHSAAHSGLRAQLDTVTRVVSVRDLATGEVTGFQLGAGQFWSGAFTDDSVVTATHVDGNLTGMSILTRAGGEVRERQVTGLPAGWNQYGLVDTQDARGAIIRMRTDDLTKSAYYLLDYATAAVQLIPAAMADRTPILAGDYLLSSPTFEDQVATVPRDNPSATPVVTQLTPPGGGEWKPARTAVVGDWLVFSHPLLYDAMATVPGGELQAVRIGGTEVHRLLRYSTWYLPTAPDGSVLATGGSGSTDWAVRRVTVGADGAPELTTMQTVPSIPATINSLAFGGGRLSFQSKADGSPVKGLYEYDTALTGTPAVGERRLAFRMPDPVGPVRTLADGHSAYLDGPHAIRPLTLNSMSTVDVPSGSTLVDAAGRYVVVNGSDGKQYIGDFEMHMGTSVLLTRTKTAAALWGNKLWKPAATTGTVDSYDLVTRKTSTAVSLGSGCVPTELQAAGRWLYWYCASGNKAGVYDQQLKKSVAVPTGEALLGDGFLVRHDATAGRLLLTDFHLGAGTAPATTAFADLPQAGSQGRGVNWTVDKYGGHVAFVDAQQRIHIKPVTVPRSPVTLAGAQAPTDVDVSASTPWQGTWLLSRPALSAKLTLKDVRGRVVRTLTGFTRQNAQLGFTWDGKDDQGAVPVGGPHTWTLSADLGDGSGLRTIASGPLAVLGGKTAPRDYDGDGTGELLTLTTGGTLSAQEVQVNSSLATSASGWPTTSVFVPFGDLDGDRCNDVLVKSSSGTLRKYSGQCKGAVRTASPYTSLGTGWELYNALTSPEDMTGDGRPDLLARGAKTGTLYLFPGTADGKLGARRVVRTSWSGFTHIVGAGDLNGDGIGDVLARSTTGKLYRCYGRADGTLGSGVVLWSDWGASYKDVVVVGDITGDGKADLVSRDKYGNLYRNSGNGNGTFGGRTKLGTGWTTTLKLF
ncbi:FG-GAP-like repeat-containing protein [Streptomyces sp. NPDC051940]|uniref:FG-GAP-like repeat-containing protein n=1 Tax=Streptomyces sp. NPDC051940 TaxID=3155675 RepID=UPI0034476A2D